MDIARGAFQRAFLARLLSGKTVGPSDMQEGPFWNEGRYRSIDNLIRRLESLGFTVISENGPRGGRHVRTYRLSEDVYG